MDQSIEALIQVLQHCGELYQAMLSLLITEKKAALSKNPNDLIQVNEEKQVVLAQLSAVERRRAEVLAQIAAHLNLAAEGLTMSTLIENAAPSHRKGLETAHTVLQQLVSKVHYANNESRLLVTHCLALVKNTLGFFGRWTASAAVYGASGNMESPGRGFGWKLSNSV